MLNINGPLAQAVAAPELALSYATKAAMKADAKLKDGKLAQVGGEVFLIDTDPSLTPNGDTVVTLSGISGQAISTRHTHDDVATMIADTRTADYLPDGTRQTTKDGFAFEADSTATSGYVTNAGGVKLKRLFSDGVVNVAAFADLVTVKDDGNDLSTWDWRPAWQGALDFVAANTQYREIRWTLNGGVSLNSSSPAHTNAYTEGGVALSVKSSNLTIAGGGRVFLRDGEGSGKEGAIFGNPDVTALSDVVFDVIEIDGNADNTSGLISAILMVGPTRPVVRSGVYMHHLTRHGAMMRPNSDQTEFGPVDVLYENPRVEHVGGIGLQATRPDGCIIAGRVKDAGDNGWDVYGNEAGDPDGGYARRVQIGENMQVHGALTGGFVESFPDSKVRGSYYDCNGLKLNRIISGAKRADVSATFSDLGYDSEGTKYGVSIGNNSGKANIHSCTFEGKKNSITSGSGCVEAILRSSCIHREIKRYIWNFANSSNSFVRCVIEDQIYDDTALSDDGWPQLCPPTDHPFYSSSAYQSTIGTMTLATGGEVLANFGKSTSVLTTPGSWGGAYSLYNIGSDGKTRINTDPNLDVSNYPIADIDGTLYELSASGTGGEYYVAEWDGSAATHGDYTSALNSALTVTLKYEGFKCPLYSTQEASSTDTLESVGGWGPGYSTYASSETSIQLTGLSIDDGQIAIINGYGYALYDSGTTDQFYARRLVTGALTAGSAGDYTRDLASDHTVYLI